ncbi:MAG: hypothetical protein QW299_04885 [Candidatus Caldarchaeum sp.]
MMLPLEGGISFMLDVPTESSHEIHGVVRGLCPVYKGLALIGEGMGIAGVVGITGRKTLFPLDAQTTTICDVIFRKIELNGLSIKYFANIVVDKPYRAAHKLFRQFYLGSDFFRPLSYLVMATRSVAVKSRYHRISSFGSVEIRYEIDGRSISVAVRRKTFGKFKILVANELSGRLFSRLRVNDSPVRFKPWMKIEKGPVELRSPLLNLAMEIEKPDDVTAYAGREVLMNWLDWAGISFELPPERDTLNYQVVFRPIE